MAAPRNDTDLRQTSMDARDIIKVGMSAERTLVVPPERTVGHFVPDMPMVYATPMMILEMELASGDAIDALLEPGWVTVGTEVDIRHLAATPVGATVRTTAKVIAVERRVIRFEVEAFDGTRRIGEGRHARGLVNVESFNKRLRRRPQATRYASLRQVVLCAGIPASRHFAKTSLRQFPRPLRRGGDRADHQRLHAVRRPSARRARRPWCRRAR